MYIFSLKEQYEKKKLFSLRQTVNEKIDCVLYTFFCTDYLYVRKSLIHFTEFKLHMKVILFHMK